jgi:hypothetical protein
MYARLNLHLPVYLTVILRPRVVYRCAYSQLSQSIKEGILRRRVRFSRFKAAQLTFATKLLEFYYFCFLSVENLSNFGFALSAILFTFLY